MNFKQMLMGVITSLGLAEKAQEKQLSDDDWSSIAASFKEKHNLDLNEIIEENKKAAEITADNRAIAAALVSKDDTDDDGITDDDSSNDVTQADTSDDDNTLAATEEGKKMVTEIENLKSNLKKVESELETVSNAALPGAKQVINTNKAKRMVNSVVSSKKHLFGIESELFDLSKKWNRMARDMKPSEDYTEKDSRLFFEEFDSYCASFAKRYNTLHSTGQLGQLNDFKVAATTGVDVDYTSFDGTGWGNEYVVRRQDAMIAYLRTLPSLRGIFPIIYGVQHKQVMVNAFLDSEYSQAYQKGRVFKGQEEVKPEEAIVHPVMFKKEFPDLTEMEKQYIGYYNREGSDVIKWNFIEWWMVQISIKLLNEYNVRRIQGKRNEPTPGVAGPAIQGSDGVLERLRSYEAENKLLPFPFGEYTELTICDYVEEFIETVGMLPFISTVSGMKLYMNSKHETWLKKAYRTKYKLDLDYTGPRTINTKLLDINGIVFVPNMGTSQKMWITIPGNIELYEDRPGEMFRFYWQRDLESMIVMSRWKEGVGAYRTGKKYDSVEELEASEREHQYIFTNDVNYPSSHFEKMDAGDATPSVLVHTSIVSVPHTAAVPITDIDDSVEGQIIRIKCGTDTNKISIAKAGKFAGISAAWNPNKGDEIWLMEVDGGNFIEVKRVDGSSSYPTFTKDDVTPSLKDNGVFTPKWNFNSTNAAATAVTDLDDGVVGEIVTLYGTGGAHAATIANGGNFVLLAASWTATDGAWIQLVLNESGVWSEIKRSA